FRQGHGSQINYVWVEETEGEEDHYRTVGVDVFYRQLKWRVRISRLPERRLDGAESHLTVGTGGIPERIGGHSASCRWGRDRGIFGQCDLEIRRRRSVQVSEPSKPALALHVIHELHFVRPWTPWVLRGSQLQTVTFCGAIRQDFLIESGGVAHGVLADAV